MQRDDVDRWLADYVEAWRTYDHEKMGALFSAEAEYRYHPYDEPIRGRDAIVSAWLDDRDEPGSWEADYRAVAVDGDVAVATGHTSYKAGHVFHNCFVMRFDDDARCSSFTEWYVERPRG